MATLRKRLGKWEVRVRRCSNKTLSKTFLEKADADKWAREAEVKIEKGLYEDLSQANTITVKELLQTYYKDVTTTKLGADKVMSGHLNCTDRENGSKIIQATTLAMKDLKNAFKGSCYTVRPNNHSGQNSSGSQSVNCYQSRNYIRNELEDGGFASLRVQREVIGLYKYWTIHVNTCYSQSDCNSNKISSEVRITENTLLNP